MAESVTFPSETRERLLHAGCEVFAEAGFRGATVRDICNRAGANIAAVNYYFRDKEGLYREVLAHAMRVALEKYPPLLDVAPSAPARERLRAFVHSFLLRLLEKSQRAWLGKLMSREMADPTTALDAMVEEHVKPLSVLLGSIVRDLAGPTMNEGSVRRCVFSIVGQCLFYHFAHPVVSKLTGQSEERTSADIAALAEHISTFSLQAVRGYAAAGGAE